MKAPLGIVAILFLLALMPACEDDPTCIDCGRKTPPGFQPLTSREAVLNNLELAYNKRIPERVDELLDENFTFYLAPGDVGGGIPAQWSRTDEVDVTTGLLDSRNAASGPVVLALSVDVQSIEVEWTPIVPLSAPTETWYATTLGYDFNVHMDSDQNFIAMPGAQAIFVVRDVDPTDATDWRLVEWRDLGGNVAAMASVGTASKTWSGIKALYRE